MAGHSQLKMEFQFEIQNSKLKIEFQNMLCYLYFSCKIVLSEGNRYFSQFLSLSALKCFHQILSITNFLLCNLFVENVQL